MHDHTFFFCFAKALWVDFGAVWDLSGTNLLSLIKVDEYEDISVITSLKPRTVNWNSIWIE